MFYKKITSSTDAVLPAGYRIYGFIYLCSSVGGNVQFFDATTHAAATGHFAAANAAAAGDSEHFIFGGQGITLEKGLSVAFGGTGTLFIYYA